MDIDASDFPVDELLDAIETYLLSDRERQRLFDICNGHMDDKEKLFQQVKHKYDIYELEKLFNIKETIPTSPNQIRLL